jgi:hypothetical protein
VNYYLWLAGQALPALILFPPGAVCLCVGGIGTLGLLPTVLPKWWWQAAIAVLAPLALSAAILLCGVLLVYRDDGWDVPAPEWPQALVAGLLLAHFPLGAVLVWWLRGVRALALCASLAAAGYSCGAAIMSGMSVSGQWL